MTGIVDSITNFLFGPIIEAQETSDEVVFKDTSLSTSDYFKTHTINECMLRELDTPATIPQPTPTYAAPKATTPPREMVSDGWFWLKPKPFFPPKPVVEEEYWGWEADMVMGRKIGFSVEFNAPYNNTLYPYEKVTFARDEYELELPPEMMED